MTSHSMCDAEPVAPEISPASRLSLNCKDSVQDYAGKSPVSKTLPVSPFVRRLCEHNIPSCSRKSFKSYILRKQDQKSTVRTSLASTVLSILYPQSIENIRMRAAFARRGRIFAGLKHAHFLAFLVASLLTLTSLCPRPSPARHAGPRGKHPRFPQRRHRQARHRRARLRTGHHRQQPRLGPRRGHPPRSQQESRRRRR